MCPKMGVLEYCVERGLHRRAVALGESDLSQPAVNIAIFDRPHMA